MKLGGFQRKRRNEPRGRARGKRKRCGTAAPGCAEDSTSMWIALRELSYGGYRYHFENEKPIRSSGKIPEMPAQRGGSDLIKVRQTRHLVVALLKLRVGFQSQPRAAVLHLWFKSDMSGLARGSSGAGPSPSPKN